nr:C40 family peptidase [Actinomycetota bacterium]
MAVGRARRSITLRTAILLALLVPASLVAVVPTTSIAAPSQEEIASARSRLLTLQREFEAVAERYNQARYELSVNESRLAETRDKMRSAQTDAQRASDRLANRAVAAYTGMGTQVDGLLNAGSVAEFSDRLEFMGAITASDAAIAVEAENARQVAQWAADEYATAVEASRERLEEMSRDRGEIERLLDEQEALYEELQMDYRSFLDAQRAAAAQAAAAEAATFEPSAPPPADESGSESGSGSGGAGYVPPANASQTQVAVQAAYSVVGTRYVWGSSDPSVGLDCSGVTVYAWRQAGVSLPHSSEAQYSMFPKIPLSAVQPGDLVYYGNYGPHIAIYVGGGKIIHASSPAPGGQTRVDSMYGYDEPWGAVRVG